MANNAHFILAPPTFISTNKPDWFNDAHEPTYQVKQTWWPNISKLHFTGRLTSSDYAMTTSLTKPQNRKQTYSRDFFGSNNAQIPSGFPGCKGQIFSSAYTNQIPDTRFYPSDDHLGPYSLATHENENFNAKSKNDEADITGYLDLNNHSNGVYNCFEDIHPERTNCDFSFSSTRECRGTTNPNKRKGLDSNSDDYQNFDGANNQKIHSAAGKNKSCFELRNGDGGGSKTISDDLCIEKLLEEKLSLSSTINPNPTVHRSLSDSTVHKRLKDNREKTVKRRKSVHFADTSGYELEIHIPISQADDYNVPPRLMEALHKIRSKEHEKAVQKFDSSQSPASRQFSLVLRFQQPFLEPTFQRRITQQKVCLESISIIPNSLSFTGVIRVANLEFEKQVAVRCSGNRWKTFFDIPARYVTSLKEFQQDQFSFYLEAPESALSSGRIEIALHYSLPHSNRDFWDNNCCLNYVIGCMEYPCGDSTMT